MGLVLGGARWEARTRRRAPVGCDIHAAPRHRGHGGPRDLAPHGAQAATGSTAAPRCPPVP
eukprot:4897019-Prymnesium_polylepis.1